MRAGALQRAGLMNLWAALVKAPCTNTVSFSHVTLRWYKQGFEFPSSVFKSSRCCFSSSSGWTRKNKSSKCTRAWCQSWLPPVSPTAGSSYPPVTDLSCYRKHTSAVQPRSQHRICSHSVIYHQCFAISSRKKKTRNSSRDFSSTTLLGRSVSHSQIIDTKQPLT